MVCALRISLRASFDKTNERKSGPLIYDRMTNAFVIMLDNKYLLRFSFGMFGDYSIRDVVVRLFWERNFWQSIGSQLN